MTSELGREEVEKAPLRGGSLSLERRGYFFNHVRELVRISQSAIYLCNFSEFPGLERAAP